MNNKYLIILLIAILLYLIYGKGNKKQIQNEKFSNSSNTIDSIKTYQDADQILLNLNKERSINLLTSNNILVPWIKNLEIHEAEALYNRIFEEQFDTDYTISELIYGVKDEEGGYELTPIEGVDEDISLSPLISDKKDIYEYNELVKFIEKVTFDETNEWGKKYGFEYMLDENSNIVGVLNPSLNDIKNLTSNKFEVNNLNVISEAKNILIDVSELDDRQKETLKLLSNKKYFMLEFIDINSVNQKVLLEFIEISSSKINEEDESNHITFIFKNVLDNKVNILESTNVTLNPVINLHLPSKSSETSINNKTYKFLLPQINDVNSVFDADSLTADSYNLKFPTTFPQKLKYRVRNNKSNILSALSNILNSYGMKQNLEWRKVVKDRKVLLDTTVSPKIIMKLKKSKINAIINLNINSIQLPKQVLGNNCLNEEKTRSVYSNLFDITKTKFDSNESFVPRRIQNDNGDILVDDNTEDGSELMYFLRVLNIENIYKSTDLENNTTDNFRSSLGLPGGDILGFPWVFKDPEPYYWSISREDEMRKSITQLKRKKMNENGNVESLNDAEIKNLLSPGQIIYGPNNIILCRVELEIVQSAVTDEIEEVIVIYIDKSGNKINIPENKDDIKWNLASLEREYLRITSNDKESNKMKDQLYLINKFIELCSKSIVRNKTSFIDRFKEPKMSIKNILNLSLNNDDEKNCVIKKVAEIMTKYSLIKNPSSPVFQEEHVIKMNRINLASIIENGIQSVERILILNKCFERSNYPDGKFLYDVNYNKIKFVNSNDILRLQRCIFSSLNTSISTEDNLNDIIYASIRIRLMLLNKRDMNGNFILNKIDDIFEREVVEQSINIISNLNYPDLVFDETFEERTNKFAQENDLTLERLNKIYEFISIDDYFSVSLDLINVPDSFNEILNEISNISDWSPDKKKNASNAINSLRARTMSMLDEKKVIILDEIKENLINRQIIGEVNKNNLKMIFNKLVKEYIDESISLDTPFFKIKEMTYSNLAIDIEESFSQGNFKGFSNGIYANYV